MTEASQRRLTVAHIYRKTGNLRAIQLLLGQTKMDSTVRYLGIELEDILAISESVEIQWSGPLSLAVQRCIFVEALRAAAQAVKAAVRCKCKV